MKPKSRIINAFYLQALTEDLTNNTDVVFTNSTNVKTTTDGNLMDRQPETDLFNGCLHSLLCQIYRKRKRAQMEQHRRVSNASQL